MGRQPPLCSAEVWVIRFQKMEERFLAGGLTGYDFEVQGRSSPPLAEQAGGPLGKAEVASHLLNVMLSLPEDSLPINRSLTSASSSTSSR